jgi:hypothetical protein
LTQGLAPTIANQYNQNVQNQQGAAGNLYNAGNTNAGILSGLQQQNLANQGQGVTARQALDAQNAGANATLAGGSGARGIPVQALGLAGPDRHSDCGAWRTVHGHSRRARSRCRARSSSANPDGLIARLTGNDSRSIAQQNLKAQYDALVPLVGPQKAMLAVMNPEAGKTILAQALEKKNYGFTKLDSDTVFGKTRRPARSKSPMAAARIAAPSRGLTASPSPSPRRRSQDLRQRGLPRQRQGRGRRKDRSAGQGRNLRQQDGVFQQGNSDGVGTSLAGKIASGVPLGNYVQSPEYQKYKQASSNFITALLRQESGAAISKSEFERYDKEYMPQPGDGPEVLAQKSEARRVAIEGMKKGAGPGYKSPTSSRCLAAGR